MISKQIANYRIARQLGSGGMGVVYLAKDERDGRQVALKLLPPALADDPDARQRFRQEADAAARLSHPAICPLLDRGETEDGQPYLVMAFCPGETLRERMRRGPLPESEALELAAETAEGLAHAHERGIIHRDIKPGNLMIRPDGKLQILDFGTAKLGGGPALTRTGTTVGTAAYMSPEQAGGLAVDERTDLWSLGAVLYEMVTGQPPFGQGHPQAVIHAIIHGRPAPPEALQPGLSPEIRTILERTLAKKPGRRFQTATEMAAALRTAAIRPPRPAGASRHPAAIPSASSMSGPSARPAADGFDTPLHRQAIEQVPHDPTATVFRPAPRPRPAWWILAIGVPVVFLYGLWCWQTFFGPEPILSNGVFQSDGLLLTEVPPECPFARAGLRAGNRITMLAGQPVTEESWLHFQRHGLVDVNYSCTFLDDGHARVCQVICRRRIMVFGETRDSVKLLIIAVMTGGWLLLAGIMIFLRPEDRLVRLWVLVLACNSFFTYAASIPPGYGGLLQRLPRGAGWLLVFTIITGIALSMEVTTYFATSFPRNVITTRRARLLLLSPSLLRFWYLAPGFAGLMLDQPVHLPGSGWLGPLVKIIRMVYLTGTGILLIIIWRSLEHGLHRRRLFHFITGLVMLLGSLGLAMAVSLTLGTRAIWPVQFCCLLGAMSGSVLMSLAILRHRLFGIRLIIRQGLQYAAARGFLLALAPLCGLILAADLLLHGDQPLHSILAARGWFYLALAAAGIAFHWQRNRWLQALDRRFFRELTDGWQVLQQLIGEIRQARDLTAAAPRIAGRITAALQLEFSALLIRPAGGDAFIPLATSRGSQLAPGRPEGPAARPVENHPLSPLPADGKLLAILRSLGQPLELNTTNIPWIQRQLSAAENEWLDLVRVEWFFPVQLDAEGPELILAVGPKCSAEPFSRKECDLLTTLAATLGLREIQQGGP